MKFSIKDKKGKLVCVVDSLKGYDAITFLESYNLIINDFLNVREKKEIDFLEYLKEKVKDNYLNNLLQENDFEYKNGILTDKEGKYEIYYKATIGSIIVYFFNSYLWLYSPKEDKKYFYYTD